MTNFTVLHPADALAAAVEAAVAGARAAHESGVCGASEWSCSWCEDAGA